MKSFAEKIEKAMIRIAILKNYRKRKRIIKSGYFDSDFYIANNPDIAASDMDPLHHFMYYGGFERRLPSARFDTAAYLRDNPEAVTLSRDPITDWIVYGSRESRKPPVGVGYSESSCDPAIVEPKAADGPDNDDRASIIAKIKGSGLFDYRYYLSAYPDIMMSAIDPIDHYVSYSQDMNLNPSASFDTYFYKIQNMRDCHSGGKGLALLDYVGRVPTENLSTRPENSISLLKVDEYIHQSRIAIHIHIYYLDYMYFIANMLRIIPFNYDLFITVPAAVDPHQVGEAFSKSGQGSVRIKVVENRGRDIAPLFIAFPDIWTEFDLVLHLHSKKSPHSEFGEKWAEWIFRHFLSDANLIRSQICHLEQCPRLAMLFPDNYHAIKRHADWGGNEENIKRILARYGVYIEELPSYAHFPAGSMSWFRTKAFNTIVNGLHLTDFETESGQIEGTLAHVFERALPLYARMTGWDVATFYLDEVPKLMPTSGREAPRASRETPVGGEGSERA